MASSLHPDYSNYDAGYEPTPPRAMSLAVAPASTSKQPRDRERERDRERDRDRSHQKAPSQPSSNHAQYRASSAVVPTRPSASTNVTPSHTTNGSSTATSSGIDVYSHPAALAYTSAHPRRTIPKFGPYLLLQTLGEGEFGKVKLGLHCKWGEEVAVKLIRRSVVAKDGDANGDARMGKVEREIEVLRTLKHPNIVRLYDVIETDKYIGIIIEYASGGELFDHILAHRYLPSSSASRLFSQLISGVWYIHSKGIVHRDLKLENLLLDRHRNIIITDFGFANRFAGREQGDLMSTSCGSPCYAAPELVISEGLYVGTAVDIWSCGVILYAMLAGYLPFDDDPANPDGDNINLLYKYIVNTPLTFPEYIGNEERDILRMMLVPDPRNRSTLQQVMSHSWLSPFVVKRNDITDGSETAFGRTVEDLERIALDNHEKKRRAYRDANTQRDAQALAQKQSAAAAKAASQQVVPSVHAPPPLVTAKTDHPFYTSGATSDDPFASPFPASPNTNGLAATPTASNPAKVAAKKQAGRHTIQVEYPDSPLPPVSPKREHERTRAQDEPEAPDTPQQKKRRGSSGAGGEIRLVSPPPTPKAKPEPARVDAPQTASKAAEHAITVPPPSVIVSSPLSTPTVARPAEYQAATSPITPVSPAVTSPSTPSKRTASSTTSDSKETASITPSKHGKEASSISSSASRDGKKSRRNTLTVMVEPIRAISSTLRGARTPRTPSSQHPPTAPSTSSKEASTAALTPELPAVPLPAPGPPAGSGTTKSSTVKANSVMQWFRVRSTNPAPASAASPVSGPAEEPDVSVSVSASPVVKERKREQHPPRTPSSASVTSSLITKFRNSVTIGTPRSASNSHRSSRTVRESSTSSGLAQVVQAPTKEQLIQLLRIHHGPTDASSTTSKDPQVVLELVQAVLAGMRVKVEREGGKFKCVRPKRAHPTRASRDDENTEGVQMVSVVGSAASAGVDKRGLPVPSNSSVSTTGSSIGGGIRGFLSRKGSQPPAAASPLSPGADGEMEIVEIGSPDEPIYGPAGLDSHDEVRFSVELTKIDRLSDIYSVDIRRMKGGLRSYRFLYEVVRRRMDLR